MAEKSITTQQSEVTPQLVIDMFSGGNSDKITEAEAKLFIEQCRQLGANPLTREAYLVKYKGKPAQMLVSVELYKKRAQATPEFHQIDSGIVVYREDGEIVHREGTCGYPGDKVLIGGWARVHQMKHGTDAVTYKEVSMKEYNKGENLWAKIPATMIAKVAIGQALREAFPAELNNTYVSEEFEQSAPIDVTPKDAPKAAAERILSNAAIKDTAKTAEPATEPVQASDAPESVSPEKTPETKKATAEKPSRGETVTHDDLPFPEADGENKKPTESMIDPATKEYMKLGAYINANKLSYTRVKRLAMELIQDKSLIEGKDLDEYPVEVLAWLNAKPALLNAKCKKVKGDID